MEVEESISFDLAANQAGYGDVTTEGKHINLKIAEFIKSDVFHLRATSPTRAVNYFSEYFCRLRN